MSNPSMKPSKWFDKPWWKAVKWIIVLAAYGYMAYKLVMYDDYASLWETIQCTMHNAQCTIFIVAALLLMPINILLESCKWRFLNRDVERMSIRQAQQQVYFGFIGAFLTPYRVGDYPARAMLLQDKSKFGQVTVMGFVGSVALTLVIVIIGLIPAVFYFDSTPAWWQIALVIVCCAAFGFFAPKFITKHFSLSTFLGAMGWSVLRYLVFGLQLFFVLKGVGVAIGMTDAVVAIPFYYLLVTVTPNMPIADVGIRGSWAMVIFDRYGEAPLVMVAIAVLYVINTLLPMVVGSIIALCRKS